MIVIILNILSNNLSSNEDITRARNRFYVQFNMLLRNFHSSYINVQFFLFRQFCLQVYGFKFWFDGSYSTTLSKALGFGYHKVVKKFLELS